eukprot:comp6178_c0_seq1/m.2007 comp6178_c0_seq1/g.2007  ORF comp6178_c0_seq1/g.2007 comp6178_c0_seq1/m.2007 type:complete len:598 (-) comp6178_c0_seq1:3-1796(-)
MAEENRKLSLKLHLEHESVLHTREQDVYGLVTLRAPFFEPIQRAPLRVVLVLDVSGSMNGEKLDLVKESVMFSIDQLKPCDSLAVVSFGSHVTTEFEMTKMDQNGRDSAKKAVKGLNAFGGTNLSGGLLKAVQVLQDGLGENDVAGMLLFTDGQANQGLTNAPDIIRAMEGASTHKNITLSSFGFGTDHDSNLLRSLSDSGNGMYYFLSTHDTIPTAFADCLGGLLSVACQNVELTVEVGGPEGTKILKVYGQTTFKLTDDGRKFKIDLSDLQSEQRRDILFRLLLPTLPSPDITTLTATVTYFNVPTSTQQTDKQFVSIARPLSENAHGGSEGEGREEARMEIDVQRNRVAASEAMAQADKAAAGGDCEKARDTLQAAITTIRASRTCTVEESKDLVSELEQSLKSVQSRQHYLSGGSHVLRGKSQMLTKQWANEIHEGEGRSISMRYTSTHKTNMIQSMRTSMSSIHPPPVDNPSRPAVQTLVQRRMGAVGGSRAPNQIAPRSSLGFGGGRNGGNVAPLDNVGNLDGGALGTISEGGMSEGGDSEVENFRLENTVVEISEEEDTEEGEEEQSDGGATKRKNSDGEEEVQKRPKLK